jgi:predicted lipoprotein with Yx(FWY)xxD motif
VTSHTARRLVVIGGLVLAAGTACASEQPATSSQSPSDSVSMKEVPGVGTVLADKSGKTLYFTDSDQPGAIKCTGDCLSLWTPAVPPNPNPQGVNLGVVQRPEGSSQLTYQNRPLYTFSLDSTDQPASGNNAKDSFGGVDFTWHAIVLNSSGPATSNDGGYGGGGGY